MNSDPSRTHSVRFPRLILWGLAVALTTSCAPAGEALQPQTTLIAPTPSNATSTSASGTPSEQITPTPSATAVDVAPSTAAEAAPSSPSNDDASIAAAQPTWLTVDSAAIDMPISSLEPTAADLASQSIVPPYTEDAYWLSNYGQPGQGSQNTTYITGHSWTDRNAPFNRLSTEVAVGDPISLTTESGTLEYVVDSVITHDKDTLKNSDIWAIVPNRLVLISCFIEDPWGKNVVITAVPTGLD